jgi:hypothetical protein
MVFFEPLPPDPSDATSAEHRVPDWDGPPTAMFSGVIPVQQVIASAEHTRVVLVELRAFREGCLLEVNAVTRRGDRPEGEWAGSRTTGLAQMFHPPTPGEPLPPYLLRFGVRFADGRKATTIHRWPGYGEPQPEPAPPVLRAMGGHGSTASNDMLDMSQPLWLWPAPPAQRFDLVVEWPAAGIELTHYQLDGARIAEAAAHAGPYWDMD